MIFGIDSYFKGIDMHLYQVSNYTDLLRAFKRIFYQRKGNRGSLSIQGQLKICKFTVGTEHRRCEKNIQEGLTPVLIWFLISGRSIRVLGNANTAGVNAKMRKVTFSLTLPSRKHAFLRSRYHTHYS